MIATLLRKPIKKTVAQNALENGCGGLNIDATRVGDDIMVSRSMSSLGVMHDDNWQSKPIEAVEAKGRWPANFILFSPKNTDNEMIATLLRKPIKKTVAQNALENGCGGLNIDATRVGYSDSESIDFNAKQRQQADPEEKGWSGHVAKVGTEIQMFKEKGRWSANFILKGSCPTEKLDSQCKDASRYFKQVTSFRDLLDYLTTLITPPKEIKSNIFVGDSDVYLWTLLHKSLHGAVIRGEFTKEQAQSLIDCMLPGSHLVLVPYDSYNAQTIVHLEGCGLEVRDSIFIPEEEEEFMYAKKASKKEREKGLDGLNREKRKNTHPTVKPITIMEWCLRDIPKGDNVVDPFMGSGTTGIAARRQGYPFVGMEISQDYLEIARARIESAKDES